jgi:hypothetical protein
MTFTDSQIATSYQQASADSSLPLDKRQEFAKKAEWFRFLAQRDKRALRHGDPLNNDSGTPPFEASSQVPKRSLKPFPTTL